MEELAKTGAGLKKKKKKVDKKVVKEIDLCINNEYRTAKQNNL
jgi:hypothetical protein